MRATVIGFALVAAAVSPAVAQSKDVKAKAKALYESGLKHYNLAEYPEAIKDWKEAYSLSKKPLLLFNIGQAYRLSGDCKLAGIFYDNYQREEPNPKNQDELDQALALCAKAPDKPVEKPIEKKPIEKKPVETIKTPVVEPPPKKEPVKSVGQTETSEPSEAEPVDAPTTTGGGMRKIGIGVGAAGVVLGGVGIFFAMQSGKQADKLDNFTGEWGPVEMAIQAKGESAATKAWIFGGVGAAAMIAGGVMFAIGGPKAVESSTVSIVPTRGGAAFGWSHRF